MLLTSKKQIFQAKHVLTDVIQVKTVFSACLFLTLKAYCLGRFQVPIISLNPIVRCPWKDNRRIILSGTVVVWSLMKWLALETEDSDKTQNNFIYFYAMLGSSRTDNVARNGHEIVLSFIAVSVTLWPVKIGYPSWKDNRTIILSGLCLYYFNRS